MLLGGVVEHQVDAQADAALTQQPGQRFQIVHGAVGRIDGAIVHHRIAAVAVAGSGLEARHQVDIGDAERFQIIEPVGDVFQVAGEAVDIEHVAGHVGPLEPVGLEVALEVEPFQLVRPLAP